MKKIVFVSMLLILFIVFFGCTEEPTGNAVKPASNDLKENSGEILAQECFENESRPCIAENTCQGKQSCENGLWSSCADVSDDGCPAGNCVEEWECKEWISCTKGVQTRTCLDSHNCKTELSKPDTIKLC